MVRPSFATRTINGKFKKNVSHCDTKPSKPAPVTWNSWGCRHTQPSWTYLSRPLNPSFWRENLTKLILWELQTCFKVWGFPGNLQACSANETSELADNQSYPFQGSSLQEVYCRELLLLRFPTNTCKFALLLREATPPTWWNLKIWKKLAWEDELLSTWKNHGNHKQ